MADIAGGSYPAVINILLALRERDRTGRGRHLDVSMTDNLFTLMIGSTVITSGGPRYRLYATKDGRMLAVGALEQKFWDEFCDVVNLEPALRDDTRDPRATGARVAHIVASETADTWARRIEGRDCCCSIVATMEQAMSDPHFVGRGLFPQLPLPLDRAFRANA
jgi:crotonobetainyl-CoA:carnitine CoA-transferase CaiB-like acyl-CoA transferase